ncbi:MULTISPECIES: hypothetical protein [unclassified Brevibacterium]|uniref:hypothetical protein n=1 Tax=unclassified Brevibacterium TaxID=2614124 RepID=UPI001E5A667F|nr:MULTISPECIES: hypothetical protein [unclassified Brevibacterium]MCD1287724.1 hypothetical protein [Brevibacterium sp. CCUG 69071]MDK8433327.1 hypothetical protein [Brevibacterium sp. H-BE7]
MTSPNFMYPQPTDDELASQQPGSTGAPSAPGGEPHSDHGGPNPQQAALHQQTHPLVEKSPRLGVVALTLSIIAASVSLVASIVLALTVGPAEAASGYYFTDIPEWMQTLSIGLLGLQGLLTGLGIAGLITGIIATVTARGRTQGIIATAVAVLAPLVSFGVFVTMSFAAA